MKIKNGLKFGDYVIEENKLEINLVFILEVCCFKLEIEMLLGKMCRWVDFLFICYFDKLCWFSEVN